MFCGICYLHYRSYKKDEYEKFQETNKEQQCSSEFLFVEYVPCAHKVCFTCFLSMQQLSFQKNEMATSVHKRKNLNELLKQQSCPFCRAVPTTYSLYHLMDDYEHALTILPEQNTRIWQMLKLVNSLYEKCAQAEIKYKKKVYVVGLVGQCTVIRIFYFFPAMKFFMGVVNMIEENQTDIKFIVLSIITDFSTWFVFVVFFLGFIGFLAMKIQRKLSKFIE